MRVFRSALPVLILLPLLLIGCRGKRAVTNDVRPVTDITTHHGRNTVEKPKPKPRGFLFEIEAGKEAGGKVARAKLANATKLPEALVQALLGRLKPLKGKPSDKKSFAFRARSLKPPRTGKTVKGVFPPPQKPMVPEVIKPGPLKVVRVSPEGALEFAPKLTVTFSQPMVAVTSHAATIAKGVPVKITPAVKGKWRWIGTRTLLFEPKIRFAKATNFKAEIPAGTKSALGSKLEKTRAWKFTTPPPRLKTHFPSYGPQRRDVMMFLEFDQDIDADEVLKTVTLKGDGDTFSLRRVTMKEILGSTLAKKLGNKLEKP